MEYKGRPSIGDSHKRSMVELIPPVPFSINQSYNADREKQDAENKENKRLLNKTNVAKIEKKLIKHFISIDNKKYIKSSSTIKFHLNTARENGDLQAGLMKRILIVLKILQVQILDL